MYVGWVGRSRAVVQEVGNSVVQTIKSLSFQCFHDVIKGGNTLAVFATHVN